MKTLRSALCFALIGVTLMIVHGQQTEEAGAAGPRVPPPPDSTAPRLGSVAVKPASVAAGAAVNGTVTLLGPAPSGGVVVTMQSSDPKLAAVPANVMVPPGANSATFVVKTSDRISGQSAVDISAQIGNSKPTIARLVVTPAAGAPGTPGATVPKGWDLKQQKKQ